MSVRNALLTLLVGRPQHGYQLKAEFDAATGEAWPLNFGQVYTTLQRLEKGGLIEAGGTEAADDGGAERTVYHITDAGNAEVATWMAEPVARPLADRDELSMKILMALATGVTDPVQIINRQRRATMETLQSVASLKVEAENDVSGDAGAGLAWLLHLDRMAMMAETEIRWLDLVEDRLSTRPDRVGPTERKEGDDAARPSTQHQHQ